MKYSILILGLLFSNISFGQQPPYKFKKFVSSIDTTEFKIVQPLNGNGYLKTYIQTGTLIWDISDDNSTFIKGNVDVLICIEGQMKNGKRDGVFTMYLIDSIDHNKKYRIGEQTFANDKLNGEWKTYTLKQTLVHLETFKDDSIAGITRNYAIDGKTITSEFDYIKVNDKYIERQYFKNGKIASETPYEHNAITGIGKKYYESGVILEITELKNGDFNGTRKYFYPNGQLWIEQIYKDGKSWTVIANYTDKGQKRDAGTLKNGNGTVIFYNEDGSIREVKNFINGVEKK